MNDRELEGRLRAWYRTEIPTDEAAPLSLRRDVAAIPRAPSGLARWFSRNRGITLLAAAALMLVGGAVAAGSGLLRLPAVVPPQPTPTAPVAITIPTAVPTASPASTTPTPTPTPTPTDAGLPAQAGQFDDVCDFGLATDSVGWVSTPAALYRTENLGRTWTEITPPGWPPAPASGRGGVASIFIDADTAYTFLPGTPGTIAVTHDGGSTWVVQLLGGTSADQSPAFWFQTSSSGSLIFWGASKTGHSQVFATSDGGSTWTGPHAGPSDSPGGISGLLGGGCSHIATQSVLVRTLTPPGDVAVANRLQVSHDAGAKWTDRTLPVGPQAPASRPSALVDKQVIAAWGDSGGRIVMALHVMFNGQDFDQIYTSLDDGRSWQYVQTPLALGGVRQFLSATEWILVAQDGPTSMSTADGGATWRTTVGSSPFDINWASFSSPDFGWAVPNCGGGRWHSGNLPPSAFCDPAGDKGFTGLLQTTDGGQTWTQLGK